MVEIHYALNGKRYMVTVPRHIARFKAKEIEATGGVVFMTFFK